MLQIIHNAPVNTPAVTVRAIKALYLGDKVVGYIFEDLLDSKVFTRTQNVASPYNAKFDTAKWDSLDTITNHYHSGVSIKVRSL